MSTMNQKAALLGSSALLVATSMTVARDAAAGLWEATPVGCATALGQGWVIGCTAADRDTPPDYFIYEDTGTAWDQEGGGANAVFITNDLTGAPWVINSSGGIYRWNGSSFVAFQPGNVGWATIAVGNPAVNAYDIWATWKDGSIWVFDGTLDSGGTDFLPVDVDLKVTKVALFEETTSCSGSTLHVPWVIDANKYVYRFTPAADGFCSMGMFDRMPGGATDIATDVVLGTDGFVYAWTGSAWQQQVIWGASAPLTRIAGSMNNLWAMTTPGTANNIFQLLQ